jgi:hypothetical protein
MAASEFELQVLAELADIKSVGAATAQQVTSLETRLFNGGSGVVQTLQSDIQEIKDDRKSDERWTRFHNLAHYSLTPLVVTAHSIARHFGINI